MTPAVEHAAASLCDVVPLPGNAATCRVHRNPVARGHRFCAHIARTVEAVALAAKEES